ncbi:GNAT family N-acetyltransferase [candidate division KSB1 bacterium]|nr:GNAT family N-acetyltransferase [candidate division KSB1 bacterium]
MLYDIRSISLDEWLPDRCMPAGDPFDPTALIPEHGCGSLAAHCQKFAPGDRRLLEGLYRDVLDRYGCCGFVAWYEGKIVGYNNFFPREIAKDIRFYGWGTDEDIASNTLVHNCISILRNDNFRRRGIGTNLMLHSLRWGKSQGWERMEVHLVLPNIASGFANEQKSGQAFWEKLGFSVFRSEEANSATKEIYGVNERYSMAVDLRR